MKKILIAGAGGAPSEGVIGSLLESDKGETIIGMGSLPSDLVLSQASEVHLVPFADDPSYQQSLLTLLEQTSPDLIHFQNDLEVFHASAFRDEITNLGTQLYMPRHSVIETCVDKYLSYKAFNKAGITVPVNLPISNPDQLSIAFSELGDEKGNIWLRASSIGAGGKGSLATNNFDFAKAWIDHYAGWGDFIAAEMLSKDTVTWLSIWWEGELVVAQSRKRTGWVHGNRSISGVTGVTKLGITCSDSEVTDLGIRSVMAVDEEPHGIYGVDFTYDRNGIPNPTEINISRFFTTVRFFTEAGLNMPVIFKDLVLYNEKPLLKNKINPLPDDLCWFRGMDTKPLLMTKSAFESFFE